jgi:hypothetical protein
LVADEAEAAVMAVATRAEAVEVKAAGEDAVAAVARGKRLPAQPAAWKSLIVIITIRNLMILGPKAEPLSTDGEKKETHAAVSQPLMLTRWKNIVLLWLTPLPPVPRQRWCYHHPLLRHLQTTIELTLH